MRILSSLAAGILFGAGMIISGMANPAKVLNFLDVAGNWDPSLAFVMIGAIATGMPGFHVMRKLQKPVFAERFHLPEKNHLDRRLVTGSILFGIGWGMAGYCPGPALTGVPLLGTSTILFVGAMLAGMMIAKRYTVAN